MCQFEQFFLTPNPRILANFRHRGPAYYYCPDAGPIFAGMRNPYPLLRYTLAYNIYRVV